MSLLNQLLKLERQCFPPGVRWTREGLAKALAKYDFIYHYDLAGGLIAFIAIKHGTDYAYIQTVNVAPPHRGEGIATWLIGEAERKAKKKGAKTMRLHVAVSNPAQLLYFKLGYRTVSFHRNFYANGESALEMHRSLNSRRRASTKKRASNSGT